MLDKIKQFFSAVKNNIVAVLGVIIGILFLVLKIKNTKLKDLEAQIGTISTQKDADVLETNIKQNMATAAANQESITHYQQALDSLAEKRKTLQAEPTDNPKDVENFWKNDK